MMRSVQESFVLAIEELRTKLFLEKHAMHGPVSIQPIAQTQLPAKTTAGIQVQMLKQANNSGATIISAPKNGNIVILRPIDITRGHQPLAESARITWINTLMLTIPMNACSGFRRSIQATITSSTEMVVTDIAQLAQNLTKEEIMKPKLLHKLMCKLIIILQLIKSQLVIKLMNSLFQKVKESLKLRLTLKDSNIN
jgi:hypothetical protein